MGWIPLEKKTAFFKLSEIFWSIENQAYLFSHFFCHVEDATQRQFCLFEFWVFHLLERLHNQDKREQSTLLFTHYLGEKSWIHVLPNNINVKVKDKQPHPGSISYDYNRYTPKIRRSP